MAVLLRFAGWTQQEIADELGEPRKTVGDFFQSEKTAQLTESDLRGAAERLPEGVDIDLGDAIGTSGRTRQGGNPEASRDATMPRSDYPDCMEFACTHCDASAEMRHEGNAQLSVVQHQLGCQTYMRQVLNRYPLKSARLPETDPPLPFAIRGDFGRFHKAIEKRQRQRETPGIKLQ